MIASIQLRTPEFQEERLKTLHTPSAVEKLPVGWHWCGLDDVTEGVFDCPHSTPKHVDEGRFYSVRTQDILGGKFDLKNCARVSEETYRSRISRAEPRFGDLVYSREGTYFGIAAEVPENELVCLGQRMVLIRPKQNLIHHSFLRWWLNSPVIAGHIRGFYDGSVAERLNLPVIRTLPVALPPLPKQKAIAAVLGSLDDKIELLREQNETLEALAQTLFKRWFIDFNFPDENGNPYKDSGGNMIASELGEIPEGWEVAKLKNFGAIVCGKTPSKAKAEYFGVDVPFIKIPDMHGNTFINVCSEYLSHAGADSQRKKTVPANSILVSCIATVGLVSMTIRDSQTNQQINAIVPNRKIVTEYLYLRIKTLYDFLQNLGAGGSATLNINTSSFSEVEVVSPSQCQLEKFHSLTGKLFTKIKTNSEQIETLTQLRDTLLPKLLKGEIRVPIES